MNQDTKSKRKRAYARRNDRDLIKAREMKKIPKEILILIKRNSKDAITWCSNLTPAQLNKLYPYLDPSRLYGYGVGELRKFEKKICGNAFFPSLEYPDEKFWTDTLFPTMFELYMKLGSSSSAKVDCLHEVVQKELENFFKQEDDYLVLVELKISCYTCDGTDIKRCDIVVKRYGEVVLIIMTKIIMTNYNQNKGNYFINLGGELTHLVNKNPGAIVLPLNIFFTKTPYLKDCGKIKNFETITYEDIKGYDILKNTITGRMGEGEECRPLAHYVINYMIDVKHVCREGQKFEEAPTDFTFNPVTPFIPLKDIINQIQEKKAAEETLVMINKQDYEEFKKLQALPNPEK